MKIYATSRSTNDTEHIISNLIGKDIWILVEDIEFGSEFYIKPLKLLPDGDLLQAYFDAKSLNEFMSYREDDSFELSEYAEALDNYVNRPFTLCESIKSIEVVQPVRIYTTAELQEIINEVLE